MDKIMLIDGLEAVFDSIIGTYGLALRYKNSRPTIFLYDNADNEDTFEALRYTFAKLYKELEMYDAQAKTVIFNTFWHALDPSSPEMAVPSQVEERLELVHMNIRDVSRIGFAKHPNTQVELCYIDPATFSFGKHSMLDHLKVVGTLEDGFNDLYLDGNLIGNSTVEMLHKFVTGDDIDTSTLLPTYHGEIDFLGKPIFCLLNVSDDEKSKASAIALIDKVTEKEAEFDEEARRLITSNLGMHMEELHKAVGDADITLDEVRSQLSLEFATFSTNDHFELGYVLYGEPKCMVALVSGTSKLGLLSYMIEYVDSYEEMS